MSDDERPVDPLPFVWPSGTRSMFSHGDGEALTFSPRPMFAQEWSSYEPYMVR